MTDIFELADALGPPKTIHIHEPSIGLQGILVIDNIASALAAGLPHGGGKAVLYGDPKMPKNDKQRLIRAFASALEAEAARATIPHICR